MRNVLADLALESEAATALALRLARAFDRQRRSRTRRLMRAPADAGRQVLDLQARQPLRPGGDGVPRRQRLRRGGRRGRDGAHLPRDAAQLDLGRRRQHHGAGPAARAAQGAMPPHALAHELAPARGAARRARPPRRALPARVEAMRRPRSKRAASRRTSRWRCRRALLRQTAPDAVFAAFCASRLGGDWGQAFGTLAPATDFDSIIARAMPR